MKKTLTVLALLWGLPAAAQNLPPGSQGAACLASAGAPTFTANNWFPLSCDLFGNLRTSGGGGGGGGGSANPYPGADYATSTAQTTGNNTAATNATNTGNTAAATGAQSDAAYGGTGTGSLVALNKGQYAILSALATTYGAQADAAAPTGNGSIIALEKAIRDRLAGTLSVAGTVSVSNTFALDATITSRLGTLGQKTSSGSTPVVIALDQSSLPISGAVTANLGTLNGAATATNQTVPFGSVGGGTAGSSSVLGGGVYNSTAPTLTNGQQAAFQFDAAGQLKVTGAGGGGGGGTVTQGPAATDTAANRWPVLAYQGGTWATTVSSGTITANLGTLGGAATAAGQAAQQGSVVGGTAATASVLSGGVYNATSPSLTNGQQAALQFDVNGKLLVSGAGGSGGGNTATTSNATDGQATSTTNQQNVVYNYVYNGTTWDRVRGTGGAISTTIGGTLPAFAATPTFNVGTTGGLALDATLTARLGTLGQKTAANSAPVTIASDQSALPVTGTFFQATQPISAASLPLPSGAATAAKQPAIGTAGTASADVISVQGIAGGVAQPVSGTVTANLGTLNGAALAANQPSPQTAGSAAAGTGLRAMGNDGAAVRDILTTTTGALEPPTAASGKVTITSTALTANTNTTIAAANANRIGIGIQCGSGGVNVSETGAALASATFGAAGSSLTIPSGTTPYFTPPVTSRTAITAYTATAQTCVVTEYLR